MLSLVTWKWNGGKQTRSFFQSEHVNTLLRMVERNTDLALGREWELVCITDTTKGLDKRIRVVPLPEFPYEIEAPGGYRFPQCYRRLWTYGREAAQVLGDRIVQIDLDVAIVRNLDHLFSRTEDYVAWGDPELSYVRYSGGFVMMDPAARPHVWETFDPVESPRLTKEANLAGSDQAWVSYLLYPNEVEVGRQDGIYRMRTLKGELPDNACIVQFSGQRGYEPWTLGNNYQWVRKHYR
jgi:hypothetical protein